METMNVALVPSKRPWNIRISNTHDYTWKTFYAFLKEKRQGETLLLPTTEQAAKTISQREARLQRHCLTLTCPLEDIERLQDKRKLQSTAKEYGLTAYFPKHYPDAKTRVFPCIMKPADGVWGKGVKIVRTPAEARAWEARLAKSTRWVYQELVVGRREMSTLLVVRDGKIKSAMTSTYTYDASEYVWPRASLVRHTFTTRLSKQRRATFGSLLRSYTGVCNVNYKTKEGTIKILEVNARVGADLGDAPPDKARAFLDVAFAEARKQAAAKKKKQDARGGPS